MPNHNNPGDQPASQHAHIPAHPGGHNQRDLATSSSIDEVQRRLNSIAKVWSDWKDFLGAVDHNHGGKNGRTRIDEIVQNLGNHLEFLGSEDATKSAYTHDEHHLVHYRDEYIKGFGQHRVLLIALDKKAFDKLCDAAKGPYYSEPLTKTTTPVASSNLQDLKVQHDTYRLKLLLEVDREERRRADIRRAAKSPASHHNMDGIRETIEQRRKQMVFPLSSQQ